MQEDEVTYQTGRSVAKSSLHRLRETGAGSVDPKVKPPPVVGDGLGVAMETVSAKSSERSPRERA